MTALTSSLVIRRRNLIRCSWIRAGADTTTTKSTRASAPVSSSRGISRTATVFPIRRIRLRNARSSWRTRGCRIFSNRGKAAASLTICRRSTSRTTSPFTTAPGNARAIHSTARPPRACCLWTAASASKTGMPARRNIAAAVDFPMPIPPVKPMIFTCQSGLAPFSRKTIASYLARKLATLRVAPARAASAAAMKASRSPSNTAEGLPFSTPVRRSLTI